MLETTSLVLNVNLDAFRQGLRDLGYVEGQNLVIDYRSADGRNERFPKLASEFVRQKVDVIVARGTSAILAAKNASPTIPVVMTTTADPFLVVSSLARPGGNVTGLTSLAGDLTQKRLVVLREIVPKVGRIAFLNDMSNPAGPSQWKDIEIAARSLGLQARLLDVRKPDDIARMFDAARSQNVEALVVTTVGLIQANRPTVTQLAVKHRLPAIYGAREFVEAGGLISYGPSFPDLYRRAASYVDKILKGAKPADLPVEQPTKFEMIINLKAAKAIGLTIPESFLLRADEVIE